MNLKFMTVETKKMDRDVTLEAIAYLTKRIEFNNEVNRMARKFMKAHGLDSYGAFNGFWDEPLPEMREELAKILETADWMDADDKKIYMGHCSQIFGGVYSPSTNTYVRERLHRCEEHLKEIELSATARTEEFADFTVKRDLGSNRMNLFFEYVPEPEVRKILKENGFRWSPYLNAWTRQLTANAEKALNRIKMELEVL